MTSIISTPSRALSVILSDTSDIPTPNLITQGLATEDTTGSLVDNNADFTYSVNPGDIVYNITNRDAATVESVNGGELYFIETGASFFIGDEYRIYQQSSFGGAQNEGCLLYVGFDGVQSIKVTTSGNDIVTFNNIASGVLPVKVKRAWKEDRGDIVSLVALW